MFLLTGQNELGKIPKGEPLLNRHGVCGLAGNWPLTFAEVAELVDTPFTFAGPQNSNLCPGGGIGIRAWLRTMSRKG